jgi:hypothetical protein
MNTSHKITHTEPQDLESLGEHPSMAILDAYHQRALAASNMSEVRNHLVLCRQCSGALLDLIQFLKDCEQPSRLWSAELTAAWEDWLAARHER